MQNEDRFFNIMKSYIDSAKSFVNLSSAGLVLPIVLKTKIIGLFGEAHELSLFVFVFMCISWLFFLISIGAGVLYQYTAVKYLEYLNDPKSTDVPPLLRPFVKAYGPGIPYGIMVVSFYIGAIAIVIYSFSAIVF